MLALSFTLGIFSSCLLLSEICNRSELGPFPIESVILEFVAKYALPLEFVIKYVSP